MSLHHRRVFHAIMILLLALCYGVRTPAAEAQLKSFQSAALGVEKEYYIFLPPGYDTETERRYPVIYLLHGYNFARNRPEIEVNTEEHLHWPSQENLPEIATCLMTETSLDAVDPCLRAAGVAEPSDVVAALRTEYPSVKLPLPPMIVVMPDGDNSFYMDRADGKALFPPMDGPEFVDGIRRGATGKYETYISKDLVTHVDSTYRTIADRDHRGIGGFSMGGIGSMFLLLRHPDIYCSVTAHSAVFTLSDWTKDPVFMSYAKDTTPEIVSVLSLTGSGKPDKEFLQSYDPYSLLRDFDRKDVHIYFEAGANDAFAGMKDFQTIKKFSAGLDKKGLASSPAEHIIPGTEGNRNGMHTGRYWRSRVGVILEFHALAFGL